MPIGKRTRRRRGARKTRRRLTRRSRRVIPRPFNMATLPLKRVHKCTLRYYEQDFTINPGIAGLPATYIFSANGMYDPNITGIGHQPLGFDQLMVMYNHYVVIASTIRVTFWSEDTTYTQHVGIQLESSVTTTASLTNSIEQGRIKWTTLGIANSGTDRRTLTMRVNPNKFLGRTKPLSDNQLKGSDSANPAEQAYFHVFCAPNNSSVDAGQIRCSAAIDYIAVFIEPKRLTQS